MASSACHRPRQCLSRRFAWQQRRQAGWVLGHRSIGNVQAFGPAALAKPVAHTIRPSGSTPSGSSPVPPAAKEKHLGKGGRRGGVPRSAVLTGPPDYKAVRGEGRKQVIEPAAQLEAWDHPDRQSASESLVAWPAMIGLQRPSRQRRCGRGAGVGGLLSSAVVPYANAASGIPSTRRFSAGTRLRFSGLLFHSTDPISIA